MKENYQVTLTFDEFCEIKFLLQKESASKLDFVSRLKAFNAKYPEAEPFDVEYHENEANFFVELLKKFN